MLSFNNISLQVLEYILIQIPAMTWIRQSEFTTLLLFLLFRADLSKMKIVFFIIFFLEITDEIKTI